MKEYFEINNQFKKYLPIFIIMLSLVLLLGSSYALLRSSQRGEETYVMNVGLLEVTFLDSETNALTVENMVPVTDEEGMQTDKELVFTIKNTGDYDAKYNLYIEETSTNPEFKTVIRYISNKNDTGYNSPKTLSEDNFLDTMASLAVGETATYKVKCWLDEQADVTYMDKTFTARVVVEVMQSNMSFSDEFKQKLFITRPNSYEEDTDGTIYISGRADDYDATTTDDIDFNYVWYSGKLWRITSIAPDGTIKMITEDLLTSIYWGADTTYSTSWVREWLNQEFLPTLYNYENIIVTDYKWNATMTTSYTSAPSETTMVGDAVGMLNAYEYYRSYKKLGTDATAYGNGYLNVGYHWWLITPYNSSSVRFVNSSSNLNYNSPSSYTFGVRPSINLKSTIEMVDGDGSYNNPYKIAIDNDAAMNDTTLLNTRQSGEYVKIENDTDIKRVFRIVGNETVNDGVTTKLVLNDYLKNGETVLNKYFSNDYTYGDGTSDSYWDYYLNNTYLATLDSNLLEQGTYYLGLYGSATSYKSTVCSSVDSNVSVISCISNTNVVDSKWTGYIGLLRVGEMFSSQTKDYTYQDASIYWLITPYSSSSVRYVNSDSYLNNYSPSSRAYGVRPSINLKSTIVIKDGSGTEQDPFIVGLPS